MSERASADGEAAAGTPYSAIRRVGRRVDAAAPLRSGLDLAAKLRATALAQTARQELLAAGARPRRQLVTGRDSLTPPAGHQI
jgi:hypothetical protein